MNTYDRAGACLIAEATNSGLVPSDAGFRASRSHDCKVDNQWSRTVVAEPDMAHRTFRDSFGREWEVWSVVPDNVERREAAQPAMVHAEAERRKRREFRVPLGRRWVNGWLCFETRGEKRRLAPFPDDWAARSDHELEQLCEHATVVKLGPRRLIE
jgi:hypothetical protein